MTETRTVSFDPNIQGRVTSIEQSLLRIAHAVETLAKRADPKFKTLKEEVEAKGLAGHR
jgi:hypothetical protein